MPLFEDDPTEHPMAYYAVTMKANELMAHSYSYLFNLPTTGLRFFTFVKAIKNGNPIKIFNQGKMIRDFAYVEDITHSISLLIKKPSKSDQNWDSNNPNTSSSTAPYNIFNIGNSNPVGLID